MCAASIEPASSLARAVSPSRAQPSATPARSQVRRARPVSASSRSPRAYRSGRDGERSEDVFLELVVGLGRVRRVTNGSLGCAGVAIGAERRAHAPEADRLLLGPVHRPCDLEQARQRCAVAAGDVDHAAEDGHELVELPELVGQLLDRGRQDGARRCRRLGCSQAAHDCGQALGALLLAPCQAGARPCLVGAPHCASTRSACAGTTLGRSGALAPMRQRRTSVAASPAAPSSASVRSWMKPSAAPNALTLALEPSPVDERDSRGRVVLGVVLRALLDDVARCLGRPPASLVAAAPRDEALAQLRQLCGRELPRHELAQTAVEDLQPVVAEQEAADGAKRPAHGAARLLEQLGELVLAQATVRDDERSQHSPRHIAQLRLVEPPKLLTEVVLRVFGRLRARGAPARPGPCSAIASQTKRANSGLAAGQREDPLGAGGDRVELVARDQQPNGFEAERLHRQRLRAAQRVLAGDRLARIRLDAGGGDDMDVVAQRAGQDVGDRDLLVGHLVEPVDDDQQRARGRRALACLAQSSLSCPCNSVTPGGVPPGSPSSSSSCALSACRNATAVLRAPSARMKKQASAGSGPCQRPSRTRSIELRHERRLAVSTRRLDEHVAGLGPATWSAMNASSGSRATKRSR